MRRLLVTACPGPGLIGFFIITSGGRDVMMKNLFVPFHLASPLPAFGIAMLSGLFRAGKTQGGNGG
jgi:hypothetical protein